MDASAWLAAEGHLLIAAATRGQVQQLTDLARQSGGHIATLGSGTPLLAELDVAENIALPAMYRHNRSLAGLLAELDGALRALGLAARLGARPVNLSRRELVCAHLLRAVAAGCGILLMPRPRPADARTALDALNALAAPAAGGFAPRLWVACLERETGDFQGLGLHAAPPVRPRAPQPQPQRQP